MAAAEMYLDMFPRTRVTRKLSVSAVPSSKLSLKIFPIIAQLISCFLSPELSNRCNGIMHCTNLYRSTFPTFLVILTIPKNHQSNSLIDVEVLNAAS